MFQTTFSQKSSTPLPPAVSIGTAIELLHDFETVNRLNPDVRGQRPIQPKNCTNKATPMTNGKSLGQVQYFEVEDDLPFIPKKLWSGGVRYQADFVPLDEGCDITVHAPGGFTSVNHWRLVHLEDRTNDIIMEDGDEGTYRVHQDGDEVGRTRSKNLLHADKSGGWYIEIVSDAKCNRTFASFVKGFLKNSHVQLQNAFIEKVKEMDSGQNGQRPPNSRRPTIGRRQSSKF